MTVSRVCNGILLLLLVVTGGYFINNITNWTFISDAQPSGQRNTFLIGRCLLDVPDGFQPVEALLSVVPQPSQSYAADSIILRETPWATEDYDREFTEYIVPYRKYAAAPQAQPRVAKDTASRYTENPQADSFFSGNRAVCLAYSVDQTSVFVHTFIALAEGVLHLEETRRYAEPPVSVDLENAAAALFSRYSWGRTPESGNQVLYTAYGMLRGYPADNESVELVLENADAIRVYCRTSSLSAPRERRSPEGVQSSPELKNAVKSEGVTFDRIQKQSQDGEEKIQVEYIDLLEGGKDAAKTVYFHVLQQPDATATPGNPYTALELTAPWDARIPAMAVWNMFVQSVRMVATESSAWQSADGLRVDFPQPEYPPE